MRFLADRGVGDVFLVSGGGIMYLLDSLGDEPGRALLLQPPRAGLRDQRRGLRARDQPPGVCFATTGPGATNAASGILGAWADSLPLLVISGQVKRELMADFSCLRQKGPQEGNILETVAPVTKYATSVTRGRRKCAASSSAPGTPRPAGRPGPPGSRSLSTCRRETRRTPRRCPAGSPPGHGRRAGTPSAALAAAAAALRAARRPLVVGGAGVRLGGAVDAFRRFCRDVRPAGGRPRLRQGPPSRGPPA